MVLRYGVRHAPPRRTPMSTPVTGHVPGLTNAPLAASVQAEELRRMAQDRELNRSALMLAQQRRDWLDSDSGTSATRVCVDLVPVAGRLGLAARGEVLVAGPVDAAGKALLAGQGFALVSRAGRLRRYRRRNAQINDVLDICARLVAAGGRAAPNYISVAGHTIKGGLGWGVPRPTSLDPGPRPAGDPRGLGVRVAVLDTGVDAAAVSAGHGWLAGVAVHDGADGNVDELDSVPVADGLLDEACGHGTFVVGLVRQLAPACEVSAVKVLESDGLGTDFALAEALVRLATMEPGPDLVNLSLSLAVPDETVPVGTSLALDLLRSRCPETLVVAAAGNGGGRVAPWPAAHPDVLTVAAVTEDGEPAAYSNRGPWVDFGVTADGVVSTYSHGVVRDANGDTEVFDTGYAAWSGTSFAAPQVTGRLAALISTGLPPAAALAALRQDCAARPAVGHVLGTIAG
jgi:hypothetical protein